MTAPAETLVLLSGGVTAAAAAWAAVQDGPVWMVHVHAAPTAPERRAEARAARAVAAQIAALAPWPARYAELPNPLTRDVQAENEWCQQAVWAAAAMLAGRPALTGLARCGTAERLAAGTWTASPRAHPRRALDKALDGLREPASWRLVCPLGAAPPAKADLVLPDAVRALTVDPPRGERPPILYERNAGGPYAGATLLGERPPAPRRAGPVALLVPHPDPAELAAARDEAAAWAAEAGREADAIPVWMPRLREAVGEAGWPAARLAAGRVIASLWRRRIAHKAARYRAMPDGP
ncbi:MAG: hypothetical protein OXC10_12260 [Rhodospirillaceae bacterium]|nr:hypothetical protein [Rhodospirillaceae bacterium]